MDKRTRTRLALLVCVAVLPFVNIFQNDWVYYDDVQIIRERADVTQPSWQGVRLILTPRGNYAPVRDLSYLLDSVLFGVGIRGYQFTNLLWHVIGGLALFGFVSRQWGDEDVGFLAAALFVVHPLRVESVAWTVGRKDLLCFAFSVLTCLAYLRAMQAERGGVKWLLASAACLSLALGSKLAALGLPIVLAALELTHQAPEKPNYITMAKRWLPLAVVTGLWFVLTVPAAQGLAKTVLGSATDVTPVAPVETIGSAIAAERAAYYWDTLRTMVVVTWLYIGMWIWPASLSPLYDIPLRSSWLEPSVVIGLLGFAVVLALGCGLWVRRYRKAVFWMVWAVAFYLPVSNLLPITALMQDRYIHLPTAAGSVLLAALLVFVSRSLIPRRMAIIGVSVYICLLMGLTLRQNRVWRSAEALWTHAQRVDPDNVRVAVTVASLPLLDNRPAEALSQLLAIRSIAGDDYRYQLLLADAYRSADRPGLAVDVYEKLHEQYPDDLQVVLGYGTLLATLGRYPDAHALANHALQMSASSVEGHVLAGGVLARMGRTEEAQSHFTSAAGLRPSHAGVHQEATLAFLAAKEYDAAAQYGQRWFRSTRDVAAARLYAEALDYAEAPPVGVEEDIALMRELWPDDVPLHELLRSR